MYIPTLPLYTEDLDHSWTLTTVTLRAQGTNPQARAMCFRLQPVAVPRDPLWPMGRELRRDSSHIPASLSSGCSGSRACNSFHTPRTGSSTHLPSHGLWQGLGSAFLLCTAELSRRGTEKDCGLALVCGSEQVIEVGGCAPLEGHVRKWMWDY